MAAKKSIAARNKEFLADKDRLRDWLQTVEQYSVLAQLQVRVLRALLDHDRTLNELCATIGVSVNELREMLLDPEALLDTDLRVLAGLAYQLDLQLEIGFRAT